MRKNSWMEDGFSADFIVKLLGRRLVWRKSIDFLDTSVLVFWCTRTYRYQGLQWSYKPHIWDPQQSRKNENVHYSSPWLPPWLRWDRDVLIGLPPEDADSCDITVEARVSSSILLITTPFHCWLVFFFLVYRERHSRFVEYYFPFDSGTNYCRRSQLCKCFGHPFTSFCQGR